MFPRLFHIGNFSLPTYGLLVSLGVLIGLWISVRNSEKQGINPEHAWNLGILVVLCGIIGAKILYIINDWSDYTAHPGEIFSFGHSAGGRSFLRRIDWRVRLAAAWYIRRHRMPALATCDAFAPGLALGHAGKSRLLRRGLLLWQTHQPFLGRDFHQSDCPGVGGHAAGGSRWSRLSFSNPPSSWRISSS